MKEKQIERISFYDAIGKNKRNSILIIFVLFFVILGLLFVIASVYSLYFSGSLAISFIPILILLLPIAVILVIIQTIPSYYYGDRLVLKATKTYKPDTRKHIYLLNIVEGLSIASGIKKPDVYIIPSKDINAFATGRDPEHASIAVTEGALEKLDRKELEGVLGHEMSHIRNYDIRYSLVIAAVVGLVAILSEMFLRSLWYMRPSGGGNNRDSKGGGLVIVMLIVGVILAIVAPIAVRLAQLAASRQREYLADASGVEITRNPSGLMGALQKIKESNKRDMKVSEAVSHLFLDDPRNSFVDSLFETHPKLDDRIARLKAMG
ncbi:MAG TPA: M48 family metallopeptidase [archaeon]|nr:M48 family metallopeptidase [archaeon]